MLQIPYDLCGFKHLQEVALFIDTDDMKYLAALTGLQELGLSVSRTSPPYPRWIVQPGDPAKPQCPQLGALTTRRQLTRLYNIRFGDDWEEFNCKVSQARYDGRVLGRGGRWVLDHSFPKSRVLCVTLRKR
jgi:hypothetical protein